MRRPLLMGLLLLGTVVGFGSGFARLHAHAGECGRWRGGRWGEATAARVTETARKDVAPAPLPASGEGQALAQAQSLGQLQAQVLAQAQQLAQAQLASQLQAQQLAQVQVQVSALSQQVALLRVEKGER